MRSLVEGLLLKGLKGQCYRFKYCLTSGRLGITCNTEDDMWPIAA